MIQSGRLQQFATPQEVYERPATRFVAEFIGASTFLTGAVVDATPERAHVRMPDGSLITSTRIATRSPQPGRSVVVAIRSERVQIAPAGAADNVIAGRITGSDYLGAKWHHQIETSAGPMMLETLDHAGGEVSVYLPPEAVILLDDEPAAAA